MKFGAIIVLLCLATATSARAATCYVAMNGDDPTAEKDNPNLPYASVAAAVGAAAADDIVSVGEGTFPLTATLVLDKAITVRGAGRGKTTICRDPSVAKLRLVKMTAEATLADLTLSGGYITAKIDSLEVAAGLYMTAGTVSGCEICCCTNTMSAKNGGAIAASGTAFLTDCVIRRNFAYDTHGTALYLSGTAKATKCLITDNESTRNTAFSAGSGATVRVAADGAELSECTVTRNFSARSGAVYQSDKGIVRNCLIWGNDGCEKTDQGYNIGYKQSANVIGCYYAAANPDFVDPANDDFRLTASSPVADGVGAFAKLSVGEDAACSFAADKLAVIVGETVTFKASAWNVEPEYYAWDFGDGTEESGAATMTHEYAASGFYTVKLMVKEGVSFTRTAYVEVRPATVNLTETDDILASARKWLPGMTVNLAAGTYLYTEELRIPESVAVFGTGYTNCILKQSGTTRAVMMFAKSRLEGVVVTGGRTAAWQGAGGIKTSGNNWTIAWCCITNNANSGNNANGGGLSVGTGTITHCIIANNKASGEGAGTSGSGGGIYVDGSVKMDNCLIYKNFATNNGGGAYFASGTSYVTNCTIVANRISTARGGGVYFANKNSRLVNCIVSDNVADKDGGKGKPNWGLSSVDDASYTAGNIRNCLWGDGVPTLGGAEYGNISGVPLFKSTANDDYHLDAKSDARNAGLAVPPMPVDLDGNERDETPDIGCYEYIAALEPFGCSLDFSPKTAFKDQEIEFSGEAVNPPAGAALTYTWLLTNQYDGVGYELSGATVRQAFPHVGKFSVTLRIAAAGALPAVKTSDYILQVAARTNYVTSAAVDTAAFPYEAPETAATNLLEVIPWLIDKSVVILDAGEHSLKGVVKLTVGATMKGAGMFGTIVDRHLGGRAFWLNHADATLEDLTVRGGYNSESYGSGANVFIDTVGGSVRRCRLTAGKVAGERHGTGGAGVAMLSGAAVVENCVIDCNTNDHQAVGTYSQGSAVRLSGGVLRNCLVTGNVCRLTSTTYVTSGKMQNCTIVGNVCNGTSEAYAVALAHATGGTVENCIFAENVSPNLTAEDGDRLAKPNWALAEGAITLTNNVRNCCWAGSRAVGKAALDPAKLVFRDAAKGDYHLSGLCRLRNGGVIDEEWMRTAVDLDGKPRVNGRSVDPGCYEMDPAGLMLLVR